MFKNNLKIAWRSFLKDRQFAFLNLVGLATGLACVLLIYLWVSNETSIDKFNKNGGQLYEVMQNVSLADGGIMTIENTPEPLAKALTEQLPEIKETAVMKSPDADGNAKGILSVNNSSIKAGELYVTSNFFNVFSYNLLQGNVNQPFPNNHCVLLSSATAIKLFHSTKNIIGKTVNWDRGGQMSKLNGSFTVSGVFEAPPANSSLKFDILFANDLYRESIKRFSNWFSSNQSTFVVLKEGVNEPQLNEKIKTFITSRYKPGSAEIKWAGTLFLQLYTDKYLYNRYENGIPAGGRIDYVKLFSLIAIFILFIACINFMNLSTAKASKRVKEVGIKKVVGASRTTLVFQYIGESMLMTVLSVLLAIAIVWALLPSFNGITGKELTLNFNTDFVLTIAAITIITGIISGSYPALYLSGFKPVLVLKGRISTSAGESLVRKGLVVFQFSISIVLIVSVIVVYQQMKLVQTKNLGYNKDHIIHFSNDGQLQHNQQAFLQDVKNLPGVVNASDMEGDILGNHSGGGGIDWPGKTQRVEFSGLYADFGFMETMGLKTVEGRTFSRNNPADTAAVLFNETAIREMGLKDPIGKTVKLWGTPALIIGVLKDFHYESLYKKVGPFFLSYRKNASNVMVKLRAGDERETIANLSTLYKQYNPGLPFEYKFLDEDYQALYASEERVAVLSRYFAGIAIIISCLGLFGLVAFTAQKRQKEIGIRKVIGATASNVVIILSKDFLQLVFIAVLIAFPVAWWLTNQWLHSFAYRTDVGADIFIVAGLSTLVIMLLTLSYQAVKAALVNPVKSLRSE